MKLMMANEHQVLADHVEAADTFWKRFRGLMGRKSLPERTAIYLTPCRSIHTFFMRFSIDVIYLDKNNHIVGLEEHLQPGKTGRNVKHARSVIEMPAGTIQASSIVEGQTVVFVNGKSSEEHQKGEILHVR
ncbi:DUF192 domain-containing protein [Siminovitchia sediminis]|uniref:DUF192 domain-containing protein n=1 Tax=Siminovitchia sediminis TaxID=1274353 RepID=A0ABW4KJT0_9BACI